MLVKMQNNMIPVDYKSLNDSPGAHLVLGRNREHTITAIRKIASNLNVKHINRVNGCLWGSVFFEDFGNNWYYDDIRAKLRGDGGILESKNMTFVSTMNLAVVNEFYFHSREDAQRRLLFAKEDGTLWRLDDERAREFYDAYGTGIESVSEILIERGMW